MSVVKLLPYLGEKAWATDRGRNLPYEVEVINAEIQFGITRLQVRPTGLPPIFEGVEPAWVDASSLTFLDESGEEVVRVTVPA